MILLDVAVVILVLLVAFNFKSKFRLFNSYDKKVLNWLFFYHYLIALFFYFFISIQGGDATNYWFVTYGFQYFNFQDVLEIVERGSPTGYLLLINYIPAKLLGLSFFTGTIIYATLGYFGFVYFYAFIKENIPNIYDLRAKKIFFLPIFPFLLFLPNLHFWTTGVGKDSLLFFCVALFIYSVQKVKRRFIGLAIAIILSIFVRPHITMFLVIAFGIGYALDGRLGIFQKIGVFSVFLIVLIFMFDYVMTFIQLDNIDIETIEEYSSTSVSNLSTEKTGSAVDTSSYPYPLKVFTFLYRPLFFDAPNIMGIIASFENLLLLLLSFKIFFSGFIKGFKNATGNMKSLFIFFLFGALSFSLIVGNLGIMLRQKTPFIMVLLIYGFYVLANHIESQKKIKSL